MPYTADISLQVEKVEFIIRLKEKEGGVRPLVAI